MNIYFLLKHIGEGRVFAKITIPNQERIILDGLVKTGKLSLTNGFYKKVNAEK